MQFDWSLFLCALGLAFVMEGAAYFLGASRMPELLRMLSERKPSELRMLGGAAMVAGLILVWIARS